MIKQKEITKVISEPVSIECDKCHKVIKAEDCSECLYSKMSTITKMDEKWMTEFHLCDECFDEFVLNNNIIVTKEEINWQ